MVLVCFGSDAAHRYRFMASFENFVVLFVAFYLFSCMP
jgi:hypothetical protein